ncbi:DoxX family protein [Priestia flexa]|jgi:putative oxidoreductase|uniref:Oxidoreductase n=2 Tax=Priestia TaxID=2800373 RepID=A0A0V8JJ37_9BACI|nr:MULTISPECIES: DoxX family protein [Priestia]KSU86968.1 oxidoreductase [Priestia veravalensis]MBN8251800.1 DoxX family protein [Priestia flexa]MBN8434784.1 DoxX family protein [Priestia flexa]MCA0967562.1 DoxX family protein [Priestia flexa]MCG7313334.1 DoxX family protein [Priestia flexa]
MKSYTIGTFFIRVVLGLTFFIHGLSKFQGGIDGTVGFFESIGIPGFMAYVVAIIELIGGVAVIVGLGTRIVAALFVFVMLGAIFTAKLGAPFVGGYELDIALLAMSLHLVFAGSGALSLDQLLRKDESYL